MNRQAMSLIHQFAYLCHLEMRDTVKHDVDKEQLEKKWTDLYEKRNAYAYKYNLKPHPDAPDNWRNKYEK